MSQLNVDAIRASNGTGDAISFTASDKTCTANITNNLSNRNLIINGAMQVAQRGTSSTTDGYGSVDRFSVKSSGADEAPTHAQVNVASGTTPYTLGFRKAMKVQNGNQTSGAGSSDRITILHLIEAQDMANSGWNYLSASSNITFSFWVKSSVAQNFYVRFKSSDSTSQAYCFETGSLSADTWTKITKTIPGNSNIVFNNDNGEGLEITWELFRGTDQTGTRPLNAWAAADNATRTPDQTSTWYTTNDATFEITGVLLEVGDSASDYPHEIYAETLTKCERYFQQCRQNIYGMTQDTNARVLWVYPLKVEMRDGPSVTATSTEYRFGNQINAAHGVSGFSINRSGYGDAKTADFAPTRSSSSSSTTSGELQFLEPTSSSHATFQFDAEL